MPTRSRQIPAGRDSAALVRGEGRRYRFAPTSLPALERDLAAVTYHEEASATVRETLFKDAKRTTVKP